MKIKLAVIAGLLASPIFFVTMCASQETLSKQTKKISADDYSRLKDGAMYNYYVDSSFRLKIIKDHLIVRDNSRKVRVSKYIKSFFVKEDEIIDDYCEELRSQFALSYYIKYPHNHMKWHFPLCVQHNPSLIKTRENEIPLLQQSAEKGSELVHCLLECSINVDEQNIETGNTALHVAGANRHHWVVQKILAAQANPNIVNNDGQTPLHVTSRVDESHGFYEKDWQGRYTDESGQELTSNIAKRGRIIQTLLGSGANPYIKDNEGNTARDYACHRTTVGILADAMRPAEIKKSGQEK